MAPSLPVLLVLFHIARGPAGRHEWFQVIHSNFSDLQAPLHSCTQTTPTGLFHTCRRCVSGPRHNEDCLNSIGDYATTLGPLVPQTGGASLTRTPGPDVAQVRRWSRDRTRSPAQPERAGGPVEKLRHCRSAFL